MIVAMSLGGLLMWTAIPAVWLLIAGRYSRVSQSDMTSFALLFSGIPATMYAAAVGLGRLERRYEDRFETHAGPRFVGARWLQSLRGDAQRERVTVLDKILVVNVVLALIALAVWFALFSHGSQAPHH
jgi:hypothetical protein